jgi:restriction endonuclease S subunit
MPEVGVMKRSACATVALGDVASNSTVATETPVADGFSRYIIGKHIPGNGSKITTWNEVGDGEFGSRIRTIIKPGDVVCTTRGPKLRVAVATFECLSAHTTFILRTKNPDVLVPEFLQAIACSDGFQDHLRRNFRGSTNLFVNWSDAARFEFPLPPLDEQRRIAYALATVEGVDEEYGRLYAAGEAALDAQISRDLLDGQREVPPSLLRVHADVQYGLTLGPSRRGRSESLPYLRVANVLRGRVDLSEIKIAGRLAGDDAYRLVDADVLVVEGHASVDEIGRAAIWRQSVYEMFHQNHLIRIRCWGTLNPEYLVLAINSGLGRSYFRAHAKNTSGLNTINSTVVKDFKLPVPPLETQAAIVRRAMLLASGLDGVRARRTELQAMKRSILTQVDRA